MPEPTKPDLTFPLLDLPTLKLADREYPMKFTWEEIFSYEQETGLSMPDGAAMRDRKTRNILRLAVAAIRGGGLKTITVDQLAAQIDLRDIKKISAIVDLAFLEVFPELNKLMPNAEANALKALGMEEKAPAETLQ